MFLLLRWQENSFQVSNWEPPLCPWITLNTCLTRNILLSVLNLIIKDDITTRNYWDLSFHFCSWKDISLIFDIQMGQVDLFIIVRLLPTVCATELELINYSNKREKGVDWQRLVIEFVHLRINFIQLNNHQWRAFPVRLAKRICCSVGFLRK